MKVFASLYFVVPLLLAFSWPAQGENPAASGQVPGKPFEVQQQQIQELQLQVADLLQQTANLQQQIADLQALLVAVRVDQNGDLVVSGANLRIQNGLGVTSCGPPFTSFDCNGKGNLIVGYDEDIGGDSKTGSHNLVIGAGHTYTSYNGIVNGRNNTISAVGGSVLNGIGNEASGFRSIVITGNNNLASGRTASVSGGRFNIASGDWSAVSGGYANMAAGEFSTVGGGLGHATGIGDIYSWTAGTLFEPN